MAILPYYYPSHSLELECDEFDCTLPVPINDEFGLWKKFIQSIKSGVYNSIEYKRFVKRCKGLEGVPMSVISGTMVTIELHHHPLTLQNYVISALDYMQHNKFSYTSNSIIDLVLRMHYEGSVTYTFLTKTEHTEFHDFNTVNIPEDEIRGDMNLIITHPILKFMDDGAKGRFLEYCPKFCKEHLDFFKVKGETI